MLESSGLIVAGLLLAHTLYHKRSPLHNSAFLGQEEERKMQTMMMYQLGQDWFQALTNNLRLLYASVDIICGNDVPNISILSRPRRCAVWKCMLIGLSYGGGACDTGACHTSDCNADCLCTTAILMHDM